MTPERLHDLQDHLRAGGTLSVHAIHELFTEIARLRSANEALTKQSQLAQTALMQSKRADPPDPKQFPEVSPYSEERMRKLIEERLLRIDRTT